MSTLGTLLLIALLLPLANPADAGEQHCRCLCLSVLDDAKLYYENGQAKPRSRNLRSLDFWRTLGQLDKISCDPTEGCQTTVCNTKTGPCCCPSGFNCKNTFKHGRACVQG